MPILASFISYRPGRKPRPARSVNSPFAVRQFDSPASPHPYASPSNRVLDINDGGARVPNQNHFGGSSHDYYRDHQANESNQSPSPQVKLNLDINREPLTNWFPESLLNPDSSFDPDSTQVSGSGSQYRYGRDTTGGSRIDETTETQESSNAEEDDVGGTEGEVDLSSAEDVLADLKAMGASDFVNHTNGEESGGYPALAYLKKSALSPIKIPSLASHGPKVQLLRSADPSRPTSEVSSLESPANSGTTLLRELMSNSYALSEDIRTSKYRSGMSNLTRSDSATLPRGEFAMLHSPYWRDRTYSGGELTLSPGSAPPPPVPVNAELVYVPPKTVRQGSDHRERRRVSSAGSFRSDPLSDSMNSATTQIDSADLSKVHRISRITEDINSLPNTPQPPAADIGIQNIEETTPSLSPEEGSSQALAARRESEKSEKSENYSEGLLSPGQRSSMSDAPSSGRDIDNVLDYYSFPDTPELGQDRNFRPAFSPISEESTSQLSPPTSFRGGKIFMSPLVSPASPNGRMGVDLSRRISETRAPMGARPSKQSLLPIGERPRSQISTPPAPSSSNLSPSVSSLYPIPTSESIGHLAPPISRVFIRERTGATPSPIKVIRDSHDLTAYNITVTPLRDNSVGSTPTTGDSDLMQQDFPETPNALSPLFSANINPSPGMRYGHNSDFIPPVPQTPMSARLPTSMAQPTLAQQMLLTRAATSVRHSRQGSSGRARVTAHPYARPPSVHDNSQENGSATSDEPAPVISGSLDNRTETSQHGIPVPPTITTRPPSDIAGETPSTIPTSTRPVGSSETIGAPLLASLVLQPSSVQESAPSLPSYHSLSEPSFVQNLSSNISGPSGETGSVSSGMGAGHNRSQSITRSRPSSRVGSINLPSDAESSNSRPTIQQRIPPSPKLPPPAPPQQSLLNVEDPFSPPPLSHVHRPIQPNTTPAPIPAVTRSASTSSHGSQGSPPPYCSIAPTGHAAGEALTPSTGGSYDPNFRFGIPHHLNSPHINTRDASSSRQPLNSHARARGKPAGPRRPSQQHPLSMPGGMRERGGSFSSVASGPATGSGRRLNPAALPSPKFQTPEPKWRGYTMDAAKWTFTSTQLQAIVSRAIRQSSEASSIRLLPLDVLDNEMPAELEALETKRTEVKTKYRALARRRGQLLEILASHTDGLDQCTPVQILRLVDDLKDVCASLDRWAVELHSADEQIAQLLQLRQAHFGSALAMALRKMNASFLKQFAEAQALRQQVHSLDAQLDRAWKQAEDVANEYDELRTGKTSSSGSGSGENRYSRISAVRKSSLRASKAGLWSGNNRLSQRSSVGSNNKMGVGQPPSARTTLYSDDIPPVPPIPRQRPANIVTDAPLRSSIGASTSGITPTSETRALVRAQEELYEMLGIGLNELRPRRSRSVTGLPGNPGHTQHLNSPTSHPLDVLNTGRRASLPGSPLPQQSHYNALTANVSIMLTADREGWI